MGKNSNCLLQWVKWHRSTFLIFSTSPQCNFCCGASKSAPYHSRHKVINSNSRASAPSGPLSSLSRRLINNSGGTAPPPPPPLTTPRHTLNTTLSLCLRMNVPPVLLGTHVDISRDEREHTIFHLEPNIEGDKQRDKRRSGKSLLSLCAFHFNFLSLWLLHRDPFSSTAMKFLYLNFILMPRTTKV